MKVDISPQWTKLANWYWDHADGPGGGIGMSIYEMLEHDYGAFRVLGAAGDIIMDFPSEQAYSMFLLRWS